MFWKIQKLAKIYFFSTVFILLRLSTAEAAEVKPEGLSQQCLQFIESLEKEHPSYYYGWIQVPQNWFDQSSGKKFNIFYYSNWKKGMTPLMYFNGGPQFDSWATLGVSDKNMTPNKIGLITFDQRGTGCSGSFPMDNSIESVRFGSLHSSDQIVKDAEALRQKMKIKKWKVFGQSYGGTIINRYLMVAPESITSAFSYAAAHVESMTEFYLARIEGAYDLARAIERSEPVLFDKIKKAKQDLKESNECLEFERGKICGETIFDAFVYHLSGLPSQLTKIFSEFEALDEAGTPTGQLDIQKIKETSNGVLAGYFGNDIAAFHAIYLNEYTSVSNVLNFAEDCVNAELFFEKFNYVSARDILINECRMTQAIFSNSNQLDYLKPLGQMRARKTIDLELVKTNLQKFRIPYYIYSGGMDGIVGQRSSVHLAMKAPKSVLYRSFPAWGHGGYNYEKIIWSDIATK